MCTDGCVAESTVVEVSPPEALDWPESDIGETVDLQCPCGNLSDLGGATVNRRALRVCGGTFTMGALWGKVEIGCNLSPTTRRLCEVANVSDCNPHTRI